MATKCVIDDKILQEAWEAFKKELLNRRNEGGKISFSYSPECKIEQKAKIKFRPEAFIKMWMLIQHFSTEVAWYATVFRDEEHENVFYVNDILLFPQTVDGGSVRCDDNEYATWLQDLPDEQFNNRRFHGHSHVNMSPYPSATDDTHRKDVISTLEDDDYYIFMIWNKTGQWTSNIYDLKNNIHYTTADIDIEFIDGQTEYLALADELVKTRTAAQQAAKKETVTKTTVTPVKTTTTAKIKTEKAVKKTKTEKAKKPEYLNYSGYQGYYQTSMYNRGTANKVYGYDDDDFIDYDDFIYGQRPAIDYLRT